MKFTSTRSTRYAEYLSFSEKSELSAYSPEHLKHVFIRLKTIRDEH